jgi:uncharacterized membrane protein
VELGILEVAVGTAMAQKLVAHGKKTTKQMRATVKHSVESGMLEVVVGLVAAQRLVVLGLLVVTVVAVDLVLAPVVAVDLVLVVVVAPKPEMAELQQLCLLVRQHLQINVEVLQHP